MRSCRSLALGMLALACLASATDAQEWIRFRGPNGTGVSEATGLPAEWTVDDYTWRVKLPGIGHSSPVLWGDQIFLTSADEANATRMVLSLSAKDGSLLWTRPFPSSVHKKHLRNSFASSTPALDDERVYVSWTAPDEFTLMALTHEGDVVWQRDLGPFVSQHSGGTSPVVYEDMVIISNFQDGDKRAGGPGQGGESFLIAVDSATGETRWKTERSSTEVAYSTPCVYVGENGQEQLIFNSGAHGITAIDPKNGKVIWEKDGLFDKRSCSSPILAGGLLFGSCGSGGGGNYIVAVKPGSSSSAPEMVYKVDKSAPYVPTPVAADGLLYLWSDQGVVSCLEAATGEELWRKRVGGGFSGSPIIADGKVYCISEEGECVVLAASREYELLGRNPLGEESRSTPTVAGNTIYLRSYTHLMAIGGK